MWQRLLVTGYTLAPRWLGRWVLRLTTPSYRVGVLAVLQRPDGCVLLVDQPYTSGWSLPGGDLKRGETPRAGLARELQEEVGLELEVGEVASAVLRTSDRWVSFVAHQRVTTEQAERAGVRSAELSAAGWFPLDRLPPLDPDATAPLRLALPGWQSPQDADANRAASPAPARRTSG